MNKTIKLSFLIITTLLFSGCFLYKDRINGTKISSTTLQEFVDDKSTQKDVISAAGYPSEKVQVGNKEIWYYEYSKVTDVSSNTFTFEVTVFEFNSKKTLISHHQEWHLDSEHEPN